ncbi:hypothetical protein KFK09_018788 [Dendrobium nobile]|uniref:Uncharacterized protein n=1 Tax=Dendrobium nobile TaxID=94219 RepID=A0A8T3AWY2_DENNO|nr:hypothetical protein KFK09_018788 [Dendrobium nobile]
MLPQAAVLHLADENISSCPATPLSNKSKKEEEDSFSTPTTAESRLNSVPSTCPPPPRKPKRVVVFKRKLTKLQFYKVEEQEIEQLFWNLESQQKNIKKRKRIHSF